MAAAEDLSQQTFLSLVKARGRFQEGSRVKPWLYAIATNAARDWQRRKRPEELTDEGELPAQVASEHGGPGTRAWRTPCSGRSPSCPRDSASPSSCTASRGWASRRSPSRWG
ncbi:RNA polymerase sigma factor [Cystobacter fuscus]